MAESPALSAWPGDETLNEAEQQLWRESEQEFKQAQVRASQRRDKGETYWTEERLQEADAQLNELMRTRTQAATNRGDMSSSMPPCSVSDPEGQSLEDLRQQIAAVQPHSGAFRRITEQQLMSGDPWCAVCLTPVCASTRTLLEQTDRLLRQRKLSRTRHRTLRDFMESIGCVELAGERGDCFTFGLYAAWGVVCRLTPRDLTLEAYCFTSSQPGPVVSDR